MPSAVAVEATVTHSERASSYAARCAGVMSGLVAPVVEASTRGAPPAGKPQSVPFTNVSVASGCDFPRGVNRLGQRKAVDSGSSSCRATDTSHCAYWQVLSSSRFLSSPVHNSGNSCCCIANKLTAALWCGKGSTACAAVIKQQCFNLL